MVEEISDFEILEIAVRELAIERGLFTAEDHRKFTEWAEQIGPAGGSRLVAKAWTDPSFKVLMLPPEVEIRVEDSNQKCRFMVLPMRPAGSESWSEEQLAEIVTRDCMIGVALPRPDRKADDVRPVHKASRPVGGEHQEPGGSPSPIQ